jgi:hypothetical protein
MEDRLREVLELLPGATADRVGQEVRVEHGGEGGVVAVITVEAIEVRLPTLRWEAQRPVADSVLWRRREWADLKLRDLRKLIRGAQAARRRQYRKCPHCGERFPPERRTQGDVCHGCPEKHLHVVF